MTTVPTIDRRATGDRRTRRVSFHYPERRTGFDRRIPTGEGLWGRCRALAYGLRERSVVLVLILAGIVGLSALDLWLTVRALDLGATELNPIMAGLLGSSPLTAGIFKLSIALAVSGGIWALRRYRRVLEVSLVFLAGMTLLAVYHLVGLAFLAG